MGKALKVLTGQYPIIVYPISVHAQTQTHICINLCMRITVFHLTFRGNISFDVNSDYKKVMELPDVP